MSDRERFFVEYAARSGTTVEHLRELGRDVFPCNCGDSICEGWQCVNRKEFLEDHPEASEAAPTKYVLGEKPCGCLVAVAKDENSDFIQECIKDGLTVRPVTPEEWESTHRDRFLADCPHEDGR